MQDIGMLKQAVHQFDCSTNSLSSVAISKGLSKDENVSYRTSHTNKVLKPLHNVCISISSSSDEDEILPSVSKYVASTKQCTSEANNGINSIPSRCEFLHQELPDLDETLSLGDQESQCSVEIAETQHGQLNVKKGKREEKKVEKKIEKSLKVIEKEIRNNTNPKLALKCFHLQIDNSLTELPDIEFFWASLQRMEINYSSVNNPVSSSIIWQRENLDYDISDNGEIIRGTENIDEDQVLIIFPVTTFTDMVQAFKQPFNSTCSTNALLECANHHKTQLPNKSISYAIIGVDKYFRESKNKQNKQYRSVARGETDEYALENLPVVSFDDVEEATVCLQINEDISCHMVDTMKDLADLVISFSKGIAESSYRKEKLQNSFSWYAEGDTCKGVKIGTSNEGLVKLWAQQIQQFSLVSKEVADAIVSNYPSPQLLMKAYRTCSTTQEAERLLKDIVIRRGFGPLVTSRRVGLELSRKMFHFFTKEDGSILL